MSKYCAVQMSVPVRVTELSKSTAASADLAVVPLDLAQLRRGEGRGWNGQEGGGKGRSNELQITLLFLFFEGRAAVRIRVRICPSPRNLLKKIL